MAKHEKNIYAHVAALSKESEIFEESEREKKFEFNDVVPSLSP